MKLQRTLSLLQKRAQRLEELGAAQPEPEQVLREDREADGQRESAQGVPVGDEPRQNSKDERGGAKMVAKRPPSHQEGHGGAR